jgi:arginyl-tRNA synthetase
LALWRRFRDLSVVKYEEVYSRLNVGYDVYAGESLVSQKNIQAAMQILKDKNLLTTKTSKESDPDWAKKRAAAAAAAPEGETSALEQEDDAAAPAQGGDLALAVDLTKWKLAKPVVQKPGKKIHS